VAAGAEEGPAAQPSKPCFELTATQYAAPFTVTSIGGCGLSVNLCERSLCLVVPVLLRCRN
jgi:hypothetical protein